MENKTVGGTVREPGSRRLTADFRMVLLNAGISRTGTSAFGVVILWVTLALTHSAVLTGLADGMAALPLFASFLVGAYVDRSARKKTLALIASAARPAAVGLMFVALMAHNIPLLAGLFFATSFLIGLTSDVMNSVRSVWTKQFLTEETYQKGTSLMQASVGLAETAGYGIAGTVLVIGYDSSLAMLVLIFAAAMIVIVPVSARRGVAAAHASVGQSVMEGMRFIKGTGFLIEGMVVALLANFLFGTIGVGLTALVQRDFHLPATYFGALLFVFSIAVIFGSVIAMKVRGSVGRIVTATIMMMGAFIALVGLSPSIYYDFVIMIPVGLLIGIVNVAVSTLVVKRVPEEMMARVQGTANTFGLAATFISGTVGGIIIEFTSVRTMLEIIGLGAMLVALLSLSFRELNRSRI